MTAEELKREVITCLTLLSLPIAIHSVLKDAELSERMTSMTPIVVLDRAAALRQLPLDSGSEERNRVMKNLQDLASQYAKEGYLVIDRAWVIAAPEDLYVR